MKHITVFIPKYARRKPEKYIPFIRKKIVYSAKKAKLKSFFRVSIANIELENPEGLRLPKIIKRLQKGETVMVHSFDTVI